MSSIKRETKKRVMKKNVETDSEIKLDNIEVVISKLGVRLHNIMREEQIIGSKAMHDTMRLLCLRFIQPLIKPNGKLYTLVDKNSYMKDGEFIEGVEEGFLEYLHLDKLLLQADSDKSFDAMLRIIWKRLLSRHELTKDIFKNSDFFIIENIKRIRKCFDVIESTLRDISFDTLNYDVKGSMYEYFINDYAGKGGKEFGQFFTPRSMIKLIRTLSKRYFPDEVKSIYDPCMGTAGFLTEMYKEYKSTLVDENVSGGELEPDTYTFALMNIILTTGSKCNIKRHDSLHNNENVKYDLIGTNPPFGMKRIKYDEVIEKCEFKDGIDPIKLYPIKTNDGSALFLQHCIGKLSDNGVCNIVLPDGQLLSGKTFIKLRKHLLTTCNLVAVLCAPSGAFTSAGVKTAVLIFSRKVVDDKLIPTDKVDFYSCDKECKEYTLMGTVCMEQFEKSNYSLDYNMYVAREEKIFTKEKCEVKTLGEVCELIKGKHSTTKTTLNAEGESKFITVSMENKWQDCDIEDYNEDAVFVSNVSSGSIWPVHYYNGKFAYCDLLRMIKTDRNVLLPKYLYYFLKVNIQNDIMEKYIKGSANKSLNVELFNKIQIPIPSLEAQQQSILDCELYEKKKNNLKEYISILKQEAECLHRLMIKPLFKNESKMKTLGEVCEIKNGNAFKSIDFQEQTDNNVGIIQIKSIQNGSIDTCKITEYIKENIKYNSFEIQKGDILIALSGATTGKIGIYNLEKKSYLNQRVGKIKANQYIIQMYIYYWYISHNIEEKILNLARGTAQPNISTKDIEEIQIPIPSLETQQQIISQYEEKMKSIDEIKNKILNVENIILECNAQQKLLFYI